MSSLDLSELDRIFSEEKAPNALTLENSTEDDVQITSSQLEITSDDLNNIQSSEIYINSNDLRNIEETVDPKDSEINLDSNDLRNIDSEINLGSNKIEENTEFNLNSNDLKNIEDSEIVVTSTDLRNINEDSEINITSNELANIEAEVEINSEDILDKPEEINHQEWSQMIYSIMENIEPAGGFKRYHSFPNTLKKTQRIIYDTKKRVFVKPDFVSPFASQKSSHCQDVFGLLEHLNLPKQLKQTYRNELGITSLFDWQIECLSELPQVLQGQNFIYSAPTSAGKTIVGELLQLSKLWKLRDKNPLQIIIMPFVSLIGEKEKRLQKLLSGLDSSLKLQCIHSHKRAQVKPDSNIVLCTIEKANQLFNFLIESEESRLKDINTVVIDELHLIGDDSRGFLLEILLTKIVFINKNLEDKIQIIAMSATFPNLNEIALWLDACLYITNFRPIQIQEYAKFGDDIVDDKGQKIRHIKDSATYLRSDFLGIFPLIVETISSGQVLVFCPTKNSCEKYCQDFHLAIGDFIKNNCLYREDLDQQLRLTFTSPGLCDHIFKGRIAYHHSGLKLEERDSIESLFKLRLLKVIFCTSTLAAGVNLPAKRVIIAGIKQGLSFLSAITYKQMVGRAGRYGFDKEADSYVVIPKSRVFNEKKIVMKMMSKDKLEQVQSCFSQRRQGMGRLVFDAIGSQMVRKQEELKEYLEGSLMYQQEKIQNEKAWDSIQANGKQALQFLIFNEIIEQKVEESRYTKKQLISRGRTPDLLRPLVSQSKYHSVQ